MEEFVVVYSVLKVLHQTRTMCLIHFGLKDSFFMAISLMIENILSYFAFHLLNKHAQVTGLEINHVFESIYVDIFIWQLENKLQQSLSENERKLAEFEQHVTEKREALLSQQSNVKQSESAFNQLSSEKEKVCFISSFMKPFSHYCLLNSVSQWLNKLYHKNVLLSTRQMPMLYLFSFYRMDHNGSRGFIHKEWMFKCLWN